MVEYDVIIIGAGSIGVPTALATSMEGLTTLVIDSFPSVAQGDNKHAIGVIRATHSLKSKIWLCQRSIKIFSNWKKTGRYYTNLIVSRFIGAVVFVLNFL